MTTTVTKIKMYLMRIAAVSVMIQNQDKKSYLLYRGNFQVNSI